MGARSLIDYTPFGHPLAHHLCALPVLFSGCPRHDSVGIHFHAMQREKPSLLSERSLTYGLAANRRFNVEGDL
jgi:hypothetical protein